MIIVLNSNRTLVIRMTEVNDSNDFNPEITRNLKSLSRRVDRLEYSQISPQEFSRAFERVYDGIDALENIVNQRFDRLEGEIQELNRKFDIVMQHITGQSGTT
jgi:predicted RNA-binding protein with EMAP domain